MHVNTNPQVRKDEQQAQKKVDGCLPQLKGGKKAFENCLVPKGEQAKAENCAIAAVKKDGVIGKKHRQQLTQDLVECGIK